MALENTTAKYEIQVVKSGTGATTATAELTALKAAASEATAALQGMSGAAASANKVAGANTVAFNGINTVTKTATASMKALAPVVTLLGVTAFPQMSGAILVSTSALSSLRGAAMASGIGMTATTGIVAALAAGVWTAVESFRALKAAQDETKSSQDLDASLKLQASRLHDIIVKAIDEERLTIDEKTAGLWDSILAGPSPAGLNALRAKLKTMLPEFYLSPESDKSRIVRSEQNDLERSIEKSQELIGPLKDRQAIEALINIEYKQRIDLIQQEYDKGLLTEKQMGALKDEALIKQLRGLNQLKQQQTELQQLEEQSFQTIAAGLASSLVNIQAWKKDAGKAFQDLFAGLAQQIAQLIIQMLILRALKAAFGTAAGGGTFMGDANLSTGANVAATGGLYPRFMAAGGIQGVNSVSRATYFPRFNVVAGEAGREMMTVLAKPRMMQVGGIQAVVGDAGANRLAITNANDLARGAGGSVNINVSLDPNLRADIVDQSVQGAVVTVTQHISQDTKLRRAVRQAST